MDFWDTVMGHNLAGMLQGTLPELADTMAELTKEVRALREENARLSDRIDELSQTVKQQSHEINQDRENSADAMFKKKDDAEHDTPENDVPALEIDLF